MTLKEKRELETAGRLRAGLAKCARSTADGPARDAHPARWPSNRAVVKACPDHHREVARRVAGGGASSRLAIRVPVRRRRQQDAEHRRPGLDEVDPPALGVDEGAGQGEADAGATLERDMAGEDD